MPRRSTWAALLCAGALTGSVLSGCGASGEAAPDADPSSRPQLGACRSLTPEDLTAASNRTAPVACSAAHTAQTFAVGDLPASTGAGYDDPGHGRFVYDTCEKAFGEFLGGDESARLRSRLSWSWFRPSEQGWDGGARWYRCDVVGGPEEATALRELPEDARGIFATDYPDAWMTCARGESTEVANKVACDEAHDWRAVTTVRVDEPEAAYPGDRIVEVRSRDYCRDSVRAWLGYPPDFEYSYTWFREDHWDGGNRRSICWARTTK